MSHIFKSPLDSKEYREITLRNGLTALLISDIEHSKFDLPVYHTKQRNACLDSDTDTESGTDSEAAMSVTDGELASHAELISDEESAAAGAAGTELEIKGLEAAPAKESKRKTKKGKIRIRCRGCPKCMKKQSSEMSGSSSKTSCSMEVVMAAAALCVSVGSFADPDDVPGFAHFLEHMVFMGSRKYKKENAFDDFIGKHGGETNAWTDCERTTFFFDIQKQYFHKALDMFACFFISPLFLKSSVDREINAVDNEFQMIVPNDTERAHQLIGTLAVPGNPMGRFMCGNTKTLKTIPREQGIDVYGRLRDFYKRMYSAHYMTLVVQAPEPLDDLQDLVYDVFEDIPNNNMLPPSFPQHQDPFLPSNFHKFFKVVPVEDTHKVDIIWPLPPVHKHFKTKPLEYLSMLIAHEGRGSILAYLRKKAWALSLVGGNVGNGFDLNSLWSGFFISITLTDAGLSNVSEVIQTVFEYVALLQQCGPQAWFFNELRDIENIKFRFREELDPIDNVEQVAENMQMYPLEHYLTGRTLILQYDPQLLQECMSCMAPGQACIMLWSKNFSTSGECEKVEPWFNTQYSVSDIPQEWKLEWTDLKASPQLKFPEKNPFIPSDFELQKVEEPSEFPIILQENQFGRMWYKKDTKFNTPKAFIYLHLMVPVLSESTTQAALCDLFINVIQQTLVETLYAATLTGYEYSLEGLSTGIVIHVDGFSHKLPNVLEIIVNHVAEFTVTQELFDVVKTQLKKCYYNEMIKTYDFAKMLRFSLTEPNNPPLPDRYRVVSSLTIDMLRDFHQHLTDSLYIEGLVMGNMTPEGAVSAAEFVQRKLCKRPLPREKIPLKRLLQLPQGDLQCRVRGVNRQDTNSCVTSYYQGGPGTIRDTCLNDLLSMRMKEPVFNRLRTSLQLGYSVFCQALSSNGILGFAVSVETQANKFSMTEIECHITKFLQDFQKTLNKMSKAQYSELVDAVITSKQVEDTQLGDEAGRYWGEILDRYYIFDRQEKEIATLKTITLVDLKAWYQKYLSNSRRHISFQVQGTHEVAMEVKSGASITSRSMPCVAMSVDSGIDDAAAAAAETADREEDFLQLMYEGPDFVKDVKDFRQGLTMFAYSTIVS